MYHKIHSTLYASMDCSDVQVVNFWTQFKSGRLLPLSQNQTGGILLQQITSSDNTEQPMLMNFGYYVVYEY
jgi:hypothetical protein